MTDSDRQEREQHALNAVSFYQNVVRVFNLGDALSDWEKKEIVKEAMDDEF